MGRKKKPAHAADYVNPSAHWVVTTEWSANGRNLVPGTEISIRGERGRFKFQRHVFNPKNNREWVDVIGGPNGAKQFRSFAPEQIKTVHWKNKIRPTKVNKKDVE